jgi:hypothetical protein
MKIRNTWQAYIADTKVAAGFKQLVGELEICWYTSINITVTNFRLLVILVFVAFIDVATLA